MAVDRSWYRVHGEVTGNINDSYRFVCLCQPIDQKLRAANIKQTEDIKTNISM